MRTVCLAVILSFISVIPSSYAQKRPSVPSIKEYAKKNQTSHWATDWFKLKEDERRYNNSVAGRQGASPNRFRLFKEIATDVLDEQKDKSYFTPSQTW
jgi:hypothetical protein